MEYIKICRIWYYIKRIENRYVRKGVAQVWSIVNFWFGCNKRYYMGNRVIRGLRCLSGAESCMFSGRNWSM